MKYKQPLYSTFKSMRAALCGGVVALLAACGGSPAPLEHPVESVSAAAVGNRTVSYQPSNEIFLNPERGFRKGLQLMAGDDLMPLRSAGYSILQGYISLRDFKNSPISDAYLAQIRSRLSDVRNAGLKASVRFWYSWGENEPDAPKTVVMNHITQLSPILRDYADVIMVLQFGFIGAWGECGSSLNGLNNPTDEREIFNALIAALPKDRKIQMRYVGMLRLFAPNGINGTQALTDPVLSRIAHHNDCLFVNQSDGGTYAWDDPQRTTDRNYLQSMSKYMPVGGEMCGDVPESGTDPYNRRTTQGQLEEFARFNWSFIANDFGNVQRWRDWGIYDTIDRSLGYRLSLTQSTVPASLALSKGRLTFSFSLKNNGWAAPFNPRLVRVILRNARNTYTFTLKVEPRTWYAGNTPTLRVDEPLPAGMAAGQYEVLLHLADPYASLTNRPEYAIRLANPNVWEANTGYNKLGQNIQFK